MEEEENSQETAKETQTKNVDNPEEYL